MNINVSKFHKHNIADTCSIWNILSSKKAYEAARHVNVKFYCTYYVIYECLYKERTKIKVEDTELRSRLHTARENTDFQSFPLDISDLQLIEILEKRKRLGRGELSSIALAIKTGQAFLTDDQKARILANEVEHGPTVQTVPHLIGWLFFEGYLLDGDKDIIIDQHKEMNGILERYFNEVYYEALRCRLYTQQATKS